MRDACMAADGDTPLCVAVPQPDAILDFGQGVVMPVYRDRSDWSKDPLSTDRPESGRDAIDTRCWAARRELLAIDRARADLSQGRHCSPTLA